MSINRLPYDRIPKERRRILGIWLAAWAVMILLVVVIGGITRLTESGLSITEWAPVTGIFPPLSDEAWQAVFLAYQEIPEYQQLNRGMTLDQFKTIFFWEYIHRVWARLIGLAIAAPLVFFWLKGWLDKVLKFRLVTLVALTGAQGALGWIMVMSGLTERTDVSQYRLAAHLGLALALYVAAVWTAADLLRNRALAVEGTPTNKSLRTYAGLLSALVFLTAMAGAFVAGIDGGMAYNSFPLMGGRFIPAGYLTIQPWWRNLFENVAAVQFNHRWIGMTTFVAVLLTWYFGFRRRVPPDVKRWLNLLPAAAIVQVTLGIATLVFAVPIAIAALHQAGAVILLTVSVLFYHGTVRAEQIVHTKTPQPSSLAS